MMCNQSTDGINLIRLNNVIVWRSTCHRESLRSQNLRVETFTKAVRFASKLANSKCEKERLLSTRRVVQYRTDTIGRSSVKSGMVLWALIGLDIIQWIVQNRKLVGIRCCKQRIVTTNFECAAFYYTESLNLHSNFEAFPCLPF